METVKETQNNKFWQGVGWAEKWICAKDKLPETDECDLSDNVLLRVNVINTKRKSEYTCSIEGYYDKDIDAWYFMLPIDDKNLEITVTHWREIHHNKCSITNRIK